MSKNDSSTKKIGAHVSSSGGHFKAVERASAIGANCVQVFSGSPRVWAKPKLESIDTNTFFTTQKMLNVSPVITHALYLINLASDKPENVQKSINSLIYELTFDSLIKGAGVVVHLGSHQGRGWEAVKEQVAQGIAEVLKKTPENSTFLIENAASRNGKIGGDLSEIQWLIEQVKSPRLGWCMDTCHAHAAGYKLSPFMERTSSSRNENPIRVAGDVKEATNVKFLEQEISRLNLWSTLKCIHVNDSRDDFASGRDRHANIGDGNIPIEDLRYFLNLEKIKDIPLILEVPGLDNEGPDQENIERVKKLLA